MELAATHVTSNPGWLGDFLVVIMILQFVKLIRFAQWALKPTQILKIEVQGWFYRLSDVLAAHICASMGLETRQPRLEIWI
jgi:hypothetical protein